MPLSPQQIEQLIAQLPAAVVQIVLQQAAVIVQQQATIKALEERVGQLEEALRQSGGGPGAAPFRIEPARRKADPKKPGRGFGHGGVFRLPPAAIDQTIEVPLAACPQCGGAIEKTTPLVQTIIELPPVRPLCVRLITHRGRCGHCARLVQSSHPLQVSARACGAAGTQLGPRALASAGLLRHGVGLTLRSCTAVLEKLFTLRISPGGLSQALDRLAQRLEGSYVVFPRKNRQ